MTTSREITVWCDAGDCLQWTYGAGGPFKTNAAARAGAKVAGWHHVNPGRDICPDCWRMGRR